MADFDIFAAAKERVNVPEAARRLDLEPNREGKARCLFHNDNTPSMHLYDTTSIVTSVRRTVTP